MNELINKISQYLFIDIETVPQSKDFLLLNEKRKSLFLEKNAKIISEDSDIPAVYSRQAGILAEFGKIICISVGYLYTDENGTILLKIKNIHGHEERALLEEFIQTVKKFERKYPEFYFAGHNIKEFDVPYICRRILVNRLEMPLFMPAYASRPWETRTIDTLHWWRFGDYKSYISLDLLAHVLEVPTSKTDIKGCDVRDVYYEDNDLERIVRYCGRDVAVVANLILRFNNLPLISEENIINT